MPRPHTGRSVIAFRLNQPGIEALDTQRGTLTRSAYLRKLAGWALATKWQPQTVNDKPATTPKPPIT